MNDRYEQFKEQQSESQKVIISAALALAGASAFVAVVTTARIATNPLSPFNFLRAPVALGAASVAAISTVAAKKLHDCEKSNPPCP